MTQPPDPHGATVRAAVARVAARMRLAAGLRAGSHAALALAISAAALVAAFRIGWLPLRGLVLGLALGLIAALAYVAARARRVADLAAPQLADRQLALADRLASARFFLDDPAPTALMEAAIADASTAAATLDARRVLTLELPRAAWAIPIAFLLLGLANLLHPRAPIAARPAVLPKPRLVVEEDALKAELEAVRKLAAEQRGKDTQLTEVAHELEALLAAIDRQELSRAEAFAKLAALEAKYSPSQGRVKPASEQLAPMAKALRETAQTKKLAEAVAKDDLEAARKELERLAAEAEKRDKDKGNDELAQALDRASRALDEAQRKLDAERDRKIQALEEEQRRLEREKKERPEDEELERRLQRNKRELERLEREKQEAQQQRRQLERLSRELEKAAEELRKQMSPEAMRRAAEQLSQMEDEIRKLGEGARAQAQIVQLKEVLRRAGQVQQGEGQQGEGRQGKGRGQQAEGNGKDGQGKQGKGGERAQRLAEFDERAGGEPNALLLGGTNPGSQSLLLPLPGTQPGGPGDQQGQGGQGDPEKPGGGIGSGHDENLLGDKTQLDARHKQIRAQGMAGKGPSRSQTILGASERGFSSREYGQAYKDYSALVEEVMSQEGIPPGYRYYVKRYFQLIRPRE